MFVRFVEAHKFCERSQTWQFPAGGIHSLVIGFVVSMDLNKRYGNELCVDFCVEGFPKDRGPQSTCSTQCVDGKGPVSTELSVVHLRQQEGCYSVK